jgi:DNA-binding XRE family transcriptional regulator
MRVRVPALIAEARLRASAAAPHLATGRRIAEARLDRQMTQTRLAHSIGVNLWTIDRLERGEVDPSGFLLPIADATGKPLQWFESNNEPRVPEESRIRSTEPLSSEAAGGRRLVLGTIVVLVTIRFFTEVFSVLPGAAAFADIPLLMLLSFAVVTRKRGTDSSGRTQSTATFLIPAVLFLAIATVSAVANLSRVEPAPALVFLYGFLAPVLFYYATYRLWPPGESRALSRTLVALGVLQFAVVVVVDLPRFAAEGNPDEISGTFGNNAYQLVFFLIIFATLVAGIATFEKGRTAARFAPLLLVSTFIVIFLAQYRALLVATAISVVAAGMLLSSVRGRGFMTAAVALMALVLGFSYVASHFPTTKFAPTVTAIRANPGEFISGRLVPFREALRLYGDSPQFIPIGTGPGTYSSRAWEIFAGVGNPANAEGSEQQYASALTGGRAYRTDVSDKYILPHIAFAESVLGSKALKSPFSTYTSLLAEVGLTGFLTVTFIYLLGLTRAVKSAVGIMRIAEPGDALPALALATAVAFLLLLQMAFLENWWEVARVTVPTWMLLAVVTKELDSRGRRAR